VASFAEIIAESFYSTVNLVWDLSGTNRATARFSVESVAVQVLFEQQEPGAAWNVSFDVERGELRQAVHLSFHIFNGVFQAVREFLEVRHPELVVFATKREALADIFQTYLRRESPTIERLGYQLEGPQLRRVIPSKWRDS
jgi:hypothetical protein